MPTYILCSSLTAEGGQTLHTTPDRMIEVNREIAEFGCKLVGQYATLGIYDFVTIIEAPDNESRRLGRMKRSRCRLCFMSMRRCPRM